MRVWVSEYAEMLIWVPIYEARPTEMHAHSNKSNIPVAAQNRNGTIPIPLQVASDVTGSRTSGVNSTQRYMLIQNLPCYGVLDMRRVSRTLSVTGSRTLDTTTHRGIWGDGGKLPKRAKLGVVGPKCHLRWVTQR